MYLPARLVRAMVVRKHDSHKKKRRVRVAICNAPSKTIRRIPFLSSENKAKRTGEELGGDRTGLFVVERAKQAEQTHRGGVARIFVLEIEIFP